MADETGALTLQEQFAARNLAWEGRVKALGVERAIYHNGHKPEEYTGIDQVQFDAIIPHLTVALGQPGALFTLDFGCGHGRWAPTLAEITGGFVLAIDPTKPLLDHARAVNPHPRVTYTRYQDGRIPADDQTTFDLLWCCMVLSTILADDMFEHTLNELRRVLKPGALVCMTDNTSKVDGRAVRSPYSISRTVLEYQAAFDWCDLKPVDQYEDLGEVNTVFLGRVR